MASLKLEAHLLQLLENERAVRAFLDRSARVWSWRLDLQGGEILFLEQGTGRILFSSAVKLIGTEDQQARTFLFSWNDPEFHEDWGAMSGLGRLRVAARDEGLSVFDEQVAFPLDSSVHALAWALAATGFLNAFLVFEAKEAARVQYVAVEQFPDAKLLHREAQGALELIKNATQRFSFAHRVALEAYLGKPTGAGATTLTQETLFWQINGTELRAVLDHKGQLLDIALELKATPEPTPELEAAPEPKRGFLERFFGKRR